MNRSYDFRGDMESTVKPAGFKEPSASPRLGVSLDDITGAVIDAAIKIHIDLGPGLLESVYEAVLARARAQGFARGTAKDHLL